MTKTRRHHRNTPQKGAPWYQTFQTNPAGGGRKPHSSSHRVGTVLHMIPADDESRKPPQVSHATTVSVARRRAFPTPNTFRVQPSGGPVEKCRKPAGHTHTHTPCRFENKIKNLTSFPGMKAHVPENGSSSTFRAPSPISTPTSVPPLEWT